MKTQLLTFLLLLLSMEKSFSQEAIYLATVKKNEKQGFINLQGREIVPVVYDDIGSFSEGLVAVNIGAKGVNFEKKGGKWGFCNYKGEIVIDLRYESADGFSEGLAGVKLKNKWGFIDHQGKQVIAPQFDEIYNFREGLCAVRIQKKWGYIDKRGKFSITPHFDNVFMGFQDGLAIVFVAEKEENEFGDIKGNYGIVDRSGKYVVEPIYQMIWGFKEGLSKVEVESPDNKYYTKVGYINRKGEIVIPPIYDSGEDFEEGFAVIGIKKETQSKLPLSKSYEYGYISKTGKLLTEIKYARAISFKKGLATVYTYYPEGFGYFSYHDTDGKILNQEQLPRCGLMDSTGKWVLPVEYSQLSYVGADSISENLIIANRITHIGSGILDVKGEVVIPFQYSNLHYFGNGLFSSNGSDDEKIKVINLNNEVLIDTDAFAMPSSKYFLGLIDVRTEQLMKSGFVDERGNWVIQPIYDMIWDFIKVN